MRGRILWDGLRNLLPAAKGQDYAGLVYEHPLICGLSQHNRPSYIPSRTFALALLDIVSGGTGRIARGEKLQARIAHLPEELGRPLNLLLDQAGNDFAQFQAGVETWFNDAMDRVAGVYKRRVQYALFFLGFVFAVALNIDTILVANRLSHDAALRAALVSSAEAYAKLPAPSSGDVANGFDPGASLAKTVAKLDDLRLPIGWSGPGLELTSPFAQTDWAQGILNAVRGHLLGWVLTAFAATLGAPFWFDLLNRFINIRAAGKAPEEKPKDPREVPQPVEPGSGPAVAGRRPQK
jgi:hypothetical protein